MTLKCLSEIAGLNVEAEYDQQFVVLFTMVMTAVNKMVRRAKPFAIEKPLLTTSSGTTLYR